MVAEVIRATDYYRSQRTQYDPGMGMDELCDALNAGLFIGNSASPSGLSSASVSFTPSGTGAASRTVQAKLRDLVSTADYSSVANFNTATDSLTETIGVSKLQLGAQALGSIYIPWRVRSADPLAGDINLAIDDSQVYVGDRDNTFSFGYNVAHGAVQELLTEPCLCFTWENNYNTGLGANQLEFHLQGAHVDSTFFRSWSWIYNRSTKETTHFIGCNTYTIVDATLAKKTLEITSISPSSGGNAVWNVNGFSVTLPAGSFVSAIAATGTTTGFAISEGGSSKVLLRRAGGAGEKAQLVGGHTDITSLTLGGGLTGSVSAIDLVTDNEVRQVQIVHTASASRYITLTGSNGGNPTISASAGNLAITPAIVGAAASGTALGGAGTSSTTALNLPASTTGVSSIRLAHGSAPTSPVNGDIWTTTAGLFVRVNGATVGPLS